MRFAPHSLLLAIAFVPVGTPAQTIDYRAAAVSQQATYGPFQVLGPTRARLRGMTDSYTPQAFERMLASHPDIRALEMGYCLGTLDDQANMRLGRMIRTHGIATHVPQRGFVGSGAVELFVAGVTRTAAATAQFGVHAWRDQSGREPADYHPDAIQNRAYIEYYRQMGMSEGEARSFYAMTNSVPHSRALYLSAAQMQGWIALELR